MKVGVISCLSIDEGTERLFVKTSRLIFLFILFRGDGDVMKAAAKMNPSVSGFVLGTESGRFLFLVFYFVFHPLCYGHDFHLHHLHHRHIPVGVRSRRSSLRRPRKYNQKLHFPACTCSSASFYNTQFYQFSNWKRESKVSSPQRVPQFHQFLRRCVQGGGPMLTPSACLSYLDRWGPLSGFTQLLNNVAANVSEVLLVKSPTDEEAQM